MLIQKDFKINRWTIISEVTIYRQYKTQKSKFALCKCECGTIREVNLSVLLKGKSRSCGCIQKEMASSKGLKIDEGRIFGKLTVLSEDFSNTSSSKRYFICQCSCNGNTKTYRLDSLLSGKVKSCSCLQKEAVSKISKTHGKANTSEYYVWQAMKDRCYNLKNSSYPDYGGRGIKVCDRWLESFENFYEDMNECPSGFALDRIDNDGGYSPENCQWTDRSVSSHNKRTNGLTSKYKGVYYDKAKKKYVARLYKNKKKIFSGYFVNEYNAAVAYDNASEVHYKDRPNKT